MLTRLSLALTVISALLLLTASSSFAASSSLDFISEETTLCLKLNSLDKTLANVDQFAIGVSPMPINATAMFKAQLGGLLGSPELAGLDTSRDITICTDFAEFPFAPVSKESSNLTAIFIPVTNYDKFIKYSRTIKTPDTNGISEFSSALELGIEDALIIRKLDSFAVITLKSNYKKLQNLDKTAKSKDFKSISKSISSKQLEMSNKNSLWLFANTSTISKDYSDLMLAPMAAGLQDTDSENPDLQQFMIFFRIYAKMMTNLLAQTDKACLALNCDGDTLAIKANVSAVKGTELAKALSSETIPAKPNTLLKYLKKGQIANFAARLNIPIWASLNRQFINTIKEDETLKSEDKTAQVKKYEDLLSTFEKSAGDNLVWSVGSAIDPEHPFDTTFIFDIKDANKTAQLFSEATDFYNNSFFKKLYQGMGMNPETSFQKNYSKYKNANISKATLKLQPTDPDSDLAEAFSQLYGSGFDYYVAITDKLCLGASNSDSEAKLKKLIDQSQTKSSGNPPQEFTNSIKIIPDYSKADMYGTYNYLRALKSTFVMDVPGTEGFRDALKNIDTDTSLAFAANFKNKALDYQVAIPKEHIKAIVEAVMTISAQTAAQQMQAMPQIESGSPTPPIQFIGE